MVKTLNSIPGALQAQINEDINAIREKFAPAAGASTVDAIDQGVQAIYASNTTELEIPLLNSEIFSSVASVPSVYSIALLNSNYTGMAIELLNVPLFPGLEPDLATIGRYNNVTRILNTRDIIEAMNGIITGTSDGLNVEITGVFSQGNVGNKLERAPGRKGLNLARASANDVGFLDLLPLLFRGDEGGFFSRGLLDSTLLIDNQALAGAGGNDNVAATISVVYTHVANAGETEARKILSLGDRDNCLIWDADCRLFLKEGDTIQSIGERASRLTSTPSKRFFPEDAYYTSRPGDYTTIPLEENQNPIATRVVFCHAVTTIDQRNIAPAGEEPQYRSVINDYRNGKLNISVTLDRKVILGETISIGRVLDSDTTSLWEGDPRPSGFYECIVFAEALSELRRKYLQANVQGRFPTMTPHNIIAAF